MIYQHISRRFRITLRCTDVISDILNGSLNRDYFDLMRLLTLKFYFPVLFYDLISYKS